MSLDLRWTRTLALTLLLPLAACGGDDMDDDDMMMDEDLAPVAAPVEDMDDDDAVMIMLASKNTSGVTGEATATHMDASVMIEMSIMGATADGAYPAHVHSGTCDATGSVLAPLTSLQVSGGTGMSTTTLDAALVGEDAEAVVQVHNPAGQPVACGDMRGHGDM